MFLSTALAGRAADRVEIEILQDSLNKKQLDDKKGRSEVAVLLSADGQPLSAEQVRIWVDNFRSSM